MGFFDKLRGEFIDIIEMTDDSNDTLVWRFERYDNEIKNGAKLIVRQSQVAIFVNEGKIADCFESGTYELETQNLPILSTLKGWKHGFSSPFKAEVYFVNIRNFTDYKWGTKNPVMLRDPEFGPLRIRAFGNYAIRVADPKKFLIDIVGTDGHFTTDEISDQLRNLIVTRFTDCIAESKIPVLDMAANYDELSEYVTNKISPEFEELGIGITKFLIENISLPEAVEKALDKRSSMGILGNMNTYTQFQSANAMEAAANNPSGGASEGIGMGMGFAMANQMAQGHMNQQQTQPANTASNVQPSTAPSAPPPIPQEVSFFLAVAGQQKGPYPITQLKQMVGGGEFEKSTLVWKDGMANWTAAEDVAELKAIFGAMPPPIPPPIPGQ
ncbi:antifreeze protein [Gammaproteobacteria bacterium 45_16_T64]|nr:antifreeze protein [Gammaproteobacteria bacterium 45_16_T64]